MRCARAIAARSRSRSPRITKRSACRCSRQWRAERRSSRRARARCPRSPATRRSTRRRTMPTRGPRRCGASSTTTRCANGLRAAGLRPRASSSAGTRAREHHLELFRSRRAMIRLGVDAWNLPGDRRGIGRYLREILRVWWERDRDRVEVTLIVPEWHTWTVRATLSARGRRIGRIASSRDDCTRRAGLDALWFPFNGCSWTNFTLPATATLHDASNFVVPDYAPETQAIFRAAAQRCRALITDSRFAQGGARARARDSARAPRSDSAGRRPAAAAGAGRARRRGIDAVRPIRRDAPRGARVSTRCSMRWRALRANDPICRSS